MKLFHGLIVFGLVFSMTFVACKKDEGTTNPGTGGGGSSFTVTVGAGLNPQYSWTVGNAFSLSVVRTAAPTVIVWGLATPGANNIASAVTHGTVPAGAVQTSFSSTETTLSAGVSYRVSVSRLDGSTGYTDFTR